MAADSTAAGVLRRLAAMKLSISRMTVGMSDGGGGGALVFVDGGGFNGGWSASEIGGNDVVVLEDDGAFGAGDFHAARVAGIGGGGRVENAQGAASKFENGGGGVFGFDLVKKRADTGLDANAVTEQPQEQVDGVDTLIEQGAAAVESERAAPARISVVLRRAIPLHAGVHYEGPAEKALVEPALEFANVRLHAILKNHTELDFGLSRGCDEGVGACRADFDGFFRQDVQAAAGRGDALGGMEAGGTADNHEIHGAMF